MAEVDGATLVARNLKKQGVQFMFGIVGFPVQPIAAAAQKASSTTSCSLLLALIIRSRSASGFWVG